MLLKLVINFDSKCLFPVSRSVNDLTTFGSHRSTENDIIPFFRLIIMHIRFPPFKTLRNLLVDCSKTDNLRQNLKWRVMCPILKMYSEVQGRLHATLYFMSIGKVPALSMLFYIQWIKPRNNYLMIMRSFKSKRTRLSAW